MSLNGLDNPAVIEAYQSALAEAGGWFLLRYVSRDEITLLDRGTGGVPDVRSAIDGYEEISPVYGFLQYRRRKVVLSYLPEGLSRLIQARTTVQFQSILDKFSPHDTVFSFAKSADLTESALSSACLLHAASGSITSSSSSLRRRRLMEIAEDAEENNTIKDQTQAPSPHPDNRQRSTSHVSEATIVPPSVTSNARETPIGDESPTVAKIPQDSQASDQVSISWDSRSERPASRRRLEDDISYAPSESRRSTQSVRPSLRDLERASTYTPKVKRGPRPSVDGSGRPRTAGNLSRNSEQRPVASLPAGVRTSSLRKGNPSPNRPRSQGSPVASVSSRTAPPVPPLLVPPLSMPISRPQLSPGAKSLSALSSSGTSNEKERLMKALQLRKTQMEKRAAESKKDRKVKDGRLTDVDENKENIDQADDKSKHDQETAAVTEHSKEPCPKTQLSIMPGSIALPEERLAPDEKLATSDSTKPDSAVGMEVANFDDEQLPNQSLLNADNALIANSEESSETPQLQASQVPPEIEADAADRDLTVPVDNDTKSGPGLPSADIHVPPQNFEKAATEKNQQIVPSPSHPNNYPVTGLDEALAVTDPADSTLPQSIPIPDSPTSNSRSSSTPEATVIAPCPAEPQNELIPEISNADSKNVNPRKDKRKPQLEPIQVPTPDYSDDENLLSDDSFMEELKSATVEEAKPVSVGKSPLSPVYPNNNDQISSHAWKNSRAVSNPSALGHQFYNMQSLSGDRSVSGPCGDMDSATGPVLVAKKINVSSGISKRIKALEKFSNSRETSSSNSGLNLAPPTASSSFEALRKRASVSLSGGNSDAGSISRHGSHTPEAFSRAPSVKRPDSQSCTNAACTTSSISVTARIVRDATNAPSDSKSDLPDSGVLNLQASPLTVERGPLDQTITKSEERSMSSSSATSGHQSRAASVSRSESRLSVSSVSKKEDALSKSTSDLSLSPEEKRASRASRLLRRMSSITSNSKKSVIGAFSPSVKEEGSERAAAEKPKVSVSTAAIDVGEVNVQFPDTLLWKRRFIRIDDKGYLILTPGNVDSTSRNMIKRYHLTEFRTPCIPDEDRQELPNSILLDFLNGSTLQCACESRQGQAFVLQTLVDAHSAHQQSLP
ncbi:putative GPI-anchored cell surface glycoprotein [Aspergillus fischeri NRRL 181]|uniref:GPI-anchored cell surface glycoprotein, putative n=1 Tax=Neosartorya fischeri (strain ATCC 1020 / DSM 3700 / CBS 544.65 / FGSC A1164 / JCM 1740 / NRRL 181 / WB 181) TaxID=331117 RepID=A1DDW2_NEOFI|nr:GPI-anchored cell surface glycoprotein, putative [Aspergillus fischeri NRRL 181]EAW17569.1 GPI-anchored cell surface glycoprotein, putative [Aspergillus fischeri NRRL 181]KAG2025485.1 hypothetical protein GB937_002739 [Aspergillus fischeri]